MEWERGETAPGRTLADLKRAGMRLLLEELILARAEDLGGEDPTVGGGAAGDQPAP
jgi:hypothetical protein